MKFNKNKGESEILILTRISNMMQQKLKNNETASPSPNSG